MNEIDYYELYGLEQPAEGANEQEAADPAAGGGNDDSLPRSPAATAPSSEGAESESDNPGTAETGAASNAEGETSETGDQQSAGKNAAYAAARRKAEAERDKAVAEAQAKAREQAEKAVDDFIAGAGIVNPMTGQPIRTRAEYDAYQAEYSRKQKEQVQKKTGMNDAELQNFIDGLPEVREARETKARAEEAQRQARAAEARSRAEEQVREISRLDPNIRTLEDLTRMDNYEDFYQKVGAGYSLLDAFKLVNFDRLQAAGAAAGRQQAMNAAAGKDHLGRTQARGAGATPIPQETLEMFRALNPNASDEEIRAFWAKEQK